MSPPTPSDRYAGIDELPDELKPDDNDVRMIAAYDQFYCTYCEYYGSPRFTGAWGQVVGHAREHPTGDPRDVTQPVGNDGRPW
jgi:hypothetical protein